MASEEPLLSDLCRICNTDIPKYCCPRCSVRTCSMKCSKRHKLWSQCSGVRDPAAYVKRSELATPAGIDRDFNFLAGIERKVESVEKECAERGIDVAVPDAHGHRPPQKGEYNMKRSMESCGVVVVMAPKGMQRSRENLTHWNKKSVDLIRKKLLPHEVLMLDHRQRCLAWTVEWFHDNGQRSLCTTLENLSIEAAYSRLKGERQSASSKKRKFDHTGEPESNPTAGGVEMTTQFLTESQHEMGAERNPSPTKHYFYLLRPRTPGSPRVLIPLPGTATLSTSLIGREVLEFPTIYVLSESPSALAKDFMLECQYLNQSAESRSSPFEAILSRIDPLDLTQDAVVSGAEQPSFDEATKGSALSEEKILDVLYKDIGAPNVV